MNTVRVNYEFPLFSILGVLFVTLKLTGYIDWSWWWVLAPFWAPVVFVALVLFGALIVAVTQAKRGKT